MAWKLVLSGRFRLLNRWCIGGLLQLPWENRDKTKGEERTSHFGDTILQQSLHNRYVRAFYVGWQR